MGRKAQKVEASPGGDIVIDLLVRHAAVPTSGDVLEAYSRIYSGRPAGHVVAVVPEPMAFGDEPAPVVEDDEVVAPPDIEVPAEEYGALEEVIAAAGDDSDNDYDAPGATVAMEAVDVPEETMTFDAAEIQALTEAAAPETVETAADPDSTDDLSEDDADSDDNATVMMGAIDESSAGAASDESSGKKKKKRRHR